MSRAATLRKKYVRKILTGLLQEGYFLTVHNGSFRVMDRDSGITPTMEAMFSTHIDRVEVFRTADKRMDKTPVGWVEFNHGGDYRELVSDYSATLEPFIANHDAALQKELIYDRRKA